MLCYNYWWNFFSPQSTMSRTFASIERPRILGAALRAGAVYVVSAMSDKIQIMCCQGNLSSVLNSVELNACQATSRHTIKRRRSAVGSENEIPPSFSAFSKDPQRFLQSSLRQWHFVKDIMKWLLLLSSIDKITYDIALNLFAGKLNWDEKRDDIYKCMYVQIYK